MSKNAYFGIDFKKHDHAHPLTDITSLDFWEVDYRFLTNRISSKGLVYPGSSGLSKNESVSLSSLAAHKSRPNIWLASDGLAKSFYSTIMTDLGQSGAGPNILLNDTALEYFTHNFTEMFDNIANAIPGPGIKSYAEAKTETGSLGTTPSVFFAKVPVPGASTEIDWLAAYLDHRS